MIDLVLVWTLLIAVSVLIYVILDGFDLGVGILFPWLGGEVYQDTAMNSIAPVWDGNETWLILAGGGLFAVFPLAYAVIMPALYAPVIAMLLGLILRGVSFEYRGRTRRGKFVWDWAFTAGSITAAFAQGIILGALLQGISVADRAYSGGWWDWLTAFSVFSGLAVVCGYGLLGATWLIMKSTGQLQQRARTLAWPLAVLTMGFIGLFSLWTPLLLPEYLANWFAWPALLYVLPVPILLVACWLALLRGLNDHREAQPFLAALGVYLICFIGLGISFFPFIVPPSVTIWDAAAPLSSLSFLLVGAGVLIPIILVYTGFTYWIFRGKVQPGEGYH